MALSDAAAAAVANWPLNEASGNAVETVNGYTGVEGGTVGAQTGKLYANARRFTATTERFTIGDNADISGGDVLLGGSLWMYWNALPSVRPSVIYRGTGGSAEFILQLIETGHGSVPSRLWFNWYGSGGFGNNVNIVHTNFGALSATTWYHVAWGHNPTSNQVWATVNGTSQTASHSAGIVNTTGDLIIGGNGAALDVAIQDLVWIRGYDHSGDAAAIYDSGTGVAFENWAGGGGGPTNPRLIGGKLLHSPLLKSKLLAA